MLKPPKTHQINPEQLAKDSVRVVQLNAAQDMLFSMTEAGEQSAVFQLEIEGVIQALVCRRCTQLELPSLVAALSGAAAAEPPSR